MLPFDQRYVNAFVPWAPTLGRLGGQLARQAYNRWMEPPPPAPVPMRGRGGRRGRGRIPARRFTQPSNPQVGRGRARGMGGGGGMGRITTGLAGGTGGSNLIIRDTEVLMTPNSKLSVLVFNPFPDQAVRGANFEKMYTRFRFRYINIAYKATTSAATAGCVTVGVLVGVKLTTITTADHILKLRPAFRTAVWRSDTLSLGNQIDSQRFMLCRGADNDSTAFCLYVMASDDAANGSIQISYEIEFAFPNPF